MGTGPWRVDTPMDGAKRYRWEIRWTMVRA
jgi:hypothetical protein